MTIERPTHERQQRERRGRRAEDIAAWLLRLKGYRIVERRFTTPLGEIDLVARRGDLLVFVEVKRRPSGVAALDALGGTQQARIARAATIFLQRRPSLRDLACRFDLIAVGGSLREGGLWPHHLEDVWRE